LPSRKALDDHRCFGEAAILNVLADPMIPGAELRLASVLLRVTGFDRPSRWMVHRAIPIADRSADPSGVPLTQVLLADLGNV
jgi:hypothetical protein